MQRHSQTGTGHSSGKMAGKHVASRSKEQALVITRVFDAPRKLVWQAWTVPDNVKRWWGPKIFTCPTAIMDFKIGGKYLNCMRSNQGQDFWSTGVYREIVPLERIVCTDNFADPNGNVVPASYYGFPGKSPEEMLVTVTFEDKGGRTKMTLRHDGLPGDMSSDARTGWNESFDKLVVLLGQIKML